MRHAFAAAVLALSLTGLQAAEPPLVGKVGTEVAFSVATEPPGQDYGLTRVQKDGKELPPPANMALDRKTGAFAWTPTESQGGDYEVAFLVRNAAGESSTVTRHITVAAPPIVPPGDNSEIAKLLRQWDKEGTAAGNVGDFYDNRDRGHSGLNTGRYPQLDRVQYTKEQLDRRMDWSLQINFLYPHVTFGNSSTASGDPALGSNSRHALLNPQAVQALYRQYTHNHLYMYPEHRDHDPGHNGRGDGMGDLFPANHPYLITSQGSSGSDQPFMQAVPYTLAAFRPDAKALLAERGLLMPAVQMIFRSSNKQLEKPEDYLTGKAHPSVFEGGNVDALKMVKMAHEITRDAVPPMVQLAAVEEDLALAGVDYFDAPRGEVFFDTPCAIARIIRSTKRDHRIVVSAKGSYDANKRPLKYHWVVLRGDAARIKITPRDDGAAAEIVAAWQKRMPVQPGSAMESNRVDIGVFAHNGACYSAPGFISLFYLDDEARTYAPDGRVLEAAYGIGDPTIGCATDRLRAQDKGYDVADWPAFLALLAPEAKGFGAELLRKGLKPEELAAFQEAAKELEAAAGKEAEPRKLLDEAEAEQKKARDAANDAKKMADEAKKAVEKDPTDATKKALEDCEAKLKALQEQQKEPDKKVGDARKALEEAQKPVQTILTSNRPALGGSVKDRLEKALNAIKDDPTLYFANAEAIQALAPDPQKKNGLTGALNNLVKWGIAKAEAEGRFGLASPVERLANGERNRIQWFNIDFLRDVVYPGLLSRRFARNYINPLLATPKTWRDVYHYDDAGHLIGWTRYDGSSTQDFTPDGALVTKRDALGRPIEARTVAYAVEASGGKPSALKQQPGDSIRYYVYASDADRVGRVEKSEKVKP